MGGTSTKHQLTDLFGFLKFRKMNKALAFGFLLLFSIAFLMIQESLADFPPFCNYPDNRPVTFVIILGT